jgi:Domain of unknown function (DUF4406)
MTRPKIALLCGPITGREPDEYTTNFALGEEWASNNGYEPLNPVEQWPHQEMPRPVYMRSSMHNLLQVDAIILLPGWQESRGARTEAIVADELGLKIVRLDWNVGSLEEV